MRLVQLPCAFFGQYALWVEEVVRTWACPSVETGSLAELDENIVIIG